MSKQLHFAGEAVRKLKLAVNLRTSAYIYGATGYGKTSVVTYVLDDVPATWISAEDAPDRILQRLRECDPSQFLVMDDLHCLESHEVQQEIVRMISRLGFRMILIGRAAVPAWLTGLVMQARLIVIPEEDLHVTESELIALLKEKGLQLPPERIPFVLEASERNIMGLNLYLTRRKQGIDNDDLFATEDRRMFQRYLEENVISQWSRDVQSLLMQVCVTDSFSLEMAEYITGDENCAALLKQAESTGNFLRCMDGEWRIRQFLLETLREYAIVTYGRRRYDQLLYNAGRFYERKGDVIHALHIYEQCGEVDSIRSLLMREARKHPGTENYWPMRRYYQALPEEEIKTDPVLMATVSMLYSVMMDTEKSEFWYDQLQAYADKVKGDARAEAIAELTYLNIGLPHRGSKDTLAIVKSLPVIVRNRSQYLRAFSITNNQPSLMNGGKDFCDWSKTDTLLAATVGPTVERILGKSGAGLTQTALGESAYEKGEDYYKVLQHLTKGQNQSESSENIELIWVDTALQARLAVTTGDIEYAHKLVNGMLHRAELGNAGRLAEAVKAFSVWMSLYSNETNAIRSWLETAPDETVEFCTLNRYLYMVKSYVYLALGLYADAQTLLERLLSYAESYQRTYIGMDCGLLNAILRKRTGYPWEEEFLELLETIASYRFVSVISEKGAAVLPLLKEIKTEFRKDKPECADWFEKVLESTEKMAHRYPDYMRGRGVDVSHFSETALQVLRMQASGFTTKEIAEKLRISQRTVKYHSAENYKKLDAKNLVDAVQIAQTLNIL